MLIDDIDSMWSFFRDELLAVINRVAPLKKIRLRNKKLPWYDDEVRKLCITRDKLHKVHLKSGLHKDSVAWCCFVECRNACKKLLRKKMVAYFAEKDASFFKTSKKYWSFYNRHISSKKSQKTKASGIKDEDNKVETDIKQQTNVFNKFFTNISASHMRCLSSSRAFIKDHFFKLKKLKKSETILSILFL
jgi:hypothetical protein